MQASPAAAQLQAAWAGAHAGGPASGAPSAPPTVTGAAPSAHPDAGPASPRLRVQVLLIANSPCGLTCPDRVLPVDQQRYAVTGLCTPDLAAVEAWLSDEPQRLVVADVRWCHAIGRSALRRLHRLAPATDWLLCWPGPALEWLPYLLDCAARGTVTCEATATERAQAFDAVMAGDLWLPRRVQQWLYEKFVDVTTEAGRGLPRGASPLSPRESEIVALLHQGLSNREIGERLGISVNTVKKHLSSGFEKLGIHRRRQLTV